MTAVIELQGKHRPRGSSLAEQKVDLLRLNAIERSLTTFPGFYGEQIQEPHLCEDLVSIGDRKAERSKERSLRRREKAIGPEVRKGHGFGRLGRGWRIGGSEGAEDRGKTASTFGSHYEDSVGALDRFGQRE